VRSLDVLARRHLDAGGLWTVHSVFTRACNLQSADGTLLGVVEAAGGNAPATLVLSENGISESLTALVAAGEPAELRDECLHVGRRLHLRLTDIQIWQPSPIVRTLPASEVEQRLRLVAEIAASIASDGGLAPLLQDALTLTDGSVEPRQAVPTGDLVVQRARQLLVALTSAIRERRWSDTAAPARALSGLGPGLTPAGDDLLVGLALGLRASLGGLPSVFETVLKDAVSGRTTDLAIARVRHAAAGHPDERTHTLLAALLMDASPSALPAAARTALEYGHSSGADTLVGLLAGTALGLGG
jgi:hypothetical protein